MKLLLFMETYSNYGPLVAWLKVVVSGDRAYCIDVSEKLSELPYESDEQIVGLLLKTFPESFMIDSESECVIEASQEVEALVRAKLWDHAIAEEYGFTVQQAIEAKLYL